MRAAGVMPSREIRLVVAISIVPKAGELARILVSPATLAPPSGARDGCARECRMTDFDRLPCGRGCEVRGSVRGPLSPARILAHYFGEGADDEAQLARRFAAERRLGWNRSSWRRSGNQLEREVYALLGGHYHVLTLSVKHI
jgi:hypothetical protein